MSGAHSFSLPKDRPIVSQHGPACPDRGCDTRAGANFRSTRKMQSIAVISLSGKKAPTIWQQRPYHAACKQLSRSGPERRVRERRVHSGRRKKC